MKKLLGGLMIAVVSFTLLAGARAQAEERVLAHDVFFTLKDKSPEAKAKLVAACKKYLTKHAGTLGFSVGIRGEEFQRDVNDQAFHVALHVIFQDKAAHDAYQKTERHAQFIQETQDNWAKVRAFDSYIEVVPSEAR